MHRIEQSINWTQAQQVSEQATENQQDKITEFLESDCELFDAADLQHYVNATGKPVSWLLAHGKNINPVLSAAIGSGCTLDELHDLDLSIPDDEEQPALLLDNEQVTVYFVPVWDDHYFIHVGDSYGFGISYPDDDTNFKSIDECKAIPHQQFIDFAKNNNLLN